jgi:hypothetical protein
VGWLCAEGRDASVRGVLLARMGSSVRSGTPSAWLAGAPARTGTADPASRPVEWELPLAQLQPLVDKVAAGGSNWEMLASPMTSAAFGLGWGLLLQVDPVDARIATRPRAVQLGLYLVSHFDHVPAPPPSAEFR